MNQHYQFITISMLLLGFIRIPATAQSNGSSMEPLIEHVLVIGVDGLSPDGIRQANTPNIDYLIKNGSATLRARGVLPSSSSPNWASMITGAGPEQHGITSNAWEKDDFTLPGAAADADGYFPSIFNLIHDQRPSSKSAAIYHWEGFGRLFNNRLVDLSISLKTEEETTAKALDYLAANRPLFCFVHLDHVDGAGHSAGHGSPAYYEAVSKADSLIGRLLAGLQENGLTENTLIILSADHGGIGFGHGGESPEELEIPFVLCGRGIKRGYTIEGAVNTVDNAATVAFALGLDMPNAWTGRPVLEAFEGYPPPRIAYPKQLLVRKPVIYPKKMDYEPAGGLYIDELPELRIQNPNAEGVIRYTLDGQPVTAMAAVYKEPMSLYENTVVKAAIFEDTKPVSPEAVAYFRVLQSNAENGVRYQTFLVDGIESLPDFDHLIATKEGITEEVILNHVDLPREEQVAVVFRTYLDIKKAGIYQFYLASDDGSKLMINGQLLVDNDGNHGVIEKSGSIKLEPGKQFLAIHWYNSGGGKGLFLYYKGPGLPKQLIPASVLFLP